MKCEGNVKCDRQFFNSGMTVKEAKTGGLVWFAVCKGCLKADGS